MNKYVDKVKKLCYNIYINNSKGVTKMNVDKQTIIKAKYIHWVREQMRKIRHDPYLNPHNQFLRVELYKWDKKGGRGLFVVYDSRRGKDLWDSEYTQWFWVTFDSCFRWWKFFEPVNYVLVNMGRSN